MEIPKTWQPAEAEAKWYQHWLDQKFFASKPNPDKEAYTIVIPPPNVTGVLHMGHMLNNTIQDVLVRRARMQGKEACWVPGTDHASIATEAKVVAMLKERGIDKRSLSREEFLSYAWEWKEKYGGIILEQLKKMGASCDWDRTRFTMEPSLSDAVIEVFVDLYNKGLIYRGVRMVNWDPAGRTAISDDEVNYKEVQSRLVYITYPIEGEVDSFITIATTRPETIFADVAICVHPDDERYKHLVGKNALIPIINKAIPIIFDTAIDLEFGTGCLKVTPAHDIVDYEIGQRHHLPIIDLLNEDGTLNEHGERYQGQDRFVVRKQIVKDLQELGLIAKIEDIKNNVGFSERTDAVIEPKLSMQWFLKMEEISKPALQAVMDDTIKLHPPKFKNMYSAWMENVRDWCISRQLWWGHQIPAYYLPNGKLVVAQTKAEALVMAQAIDASYTEADLKQDEDVLDTWFSSWLWPISVFDGFKDPENEDIKFYYPTDTLVTAPEILFFWVARMIIAGYEYRGALPFKDVYLTGIVRDKQGRKMSKSLGNSPDPFELIAKYGADGMRAGMLFSSPAGNDLPFDEKLCEQGRNFSNKIWNAFRLIKGWEVDNNLPQPETNKVAITWFEANFNQALAEIEEQYSKFRISEVLLKIYNLVWDDFCSWYLEMIKPGYEQPIDIVTRDKSLALLEQLIKVLHPFMPFITEEIYQHLQERTISDSICVSAYPTLHSADSTILAQAEIAFQIISEVRNIRATKQISPKEALPLEVKTSNPELYSTWGATINKLANISELTVNTGNAEGAATFMVKQEECALIIGSAIDPETERANLAKELEYAKGFLDSVRKKLSNEKFVANAKADVLERERAKEADALAKIAAIEKQLG